MVNRNHLGQVENSLSFHCLLDRSKKRSCNFWVLHPDCLLGLKELRWGIPLPKFNVPLVCKENASLTSLQVCGPMSKLWPHYLALRKRAEVPKAWSLAPQKQFESRQTKSMWNWWVLTCGRKEQWWDFVPCGSQVQACWIPTALSGLVTLTCGLVLFLK